MNFQKDDAFERCFLVSEDLHRGFIKIFGDENPLHVSDSFAKSKGFRSKVMHGNILCGFLSYFIGQVLPIKDVIIHSQEIQFNHVVYINQVLKFKAKVIGVYESVRAIEFKFIFLNDEGIVVSKGKLQIGVIL